MIALGVSALPFDDPAGFTAPAAFGPFRVLHQIGSGVLGPVFRTFDPEQEKLVAVKVFRLDVVPEVSARLADSLKRLAAVPVEHPAVVPVIDAGLEGTTAFLAMEYVAAETLDVSLRRLAPAGIETAIPLLRQVAEALEAAWSAGIGHGALHPRDIFVLPATVEPSHGKTEIRVSGFGVTDALEELRIPTPVRRPYAAPERDAGTWDIRADVYSLGVIAHELLTGRRPTGTVEQDVELPADTSPEQRIAIRHALSGALAAEPEHRFDTPMAFIDALTTGALPEAAAEAPLLPWPVEPDADVQPEPEDESEAGMAFGVEPESEPEIEPEVALDPEPKDVSATPHRMWPAEQEPAREAQRSTAAPPVFLGVQSPPDRREPFHAYGDTPKESAMPRALGVAAMMVVALAVGTGFGYWLRGPAPTVATEDVTKVPPDEPIGTDVAVNDAPAQTPAATPPPQAAPIAEPVSTRGRLLVRSVPGGATVLINGRESGTTPATIRDLAFGTYTVAVSRSGYQRREQRVTISKAVPAREVTLELRAAAAPPAVSGATTGSVLVETRPTGATVSIDGRVVGTAPMRVPELSPGSHTVRVTLAGYKTMTTTVVVRAGQQALVRVSLEIQ